MAVVGNPSLGLQTQSKVMSNYIKAQTRSVDFRYGCIGRTHAKLRNFKIQAMEPDWMTANHIEACRQTISRRLDRNAKMWIRVFPDKPVTKKPAEVRQGKGKGDVDRWVCVVKPGRILFEFTGVTEEQAKRIEQLVSYKLPFRTRLKRKIRMGGEQ